MERGPRELSIETALRELLGGHRNARGITEAASLNLDRLQDVEAAVGVAFGDDVLALFASALPELKAMRVGVESVIGLTGEVRAEKLRGDLVGIGRTSDRRFVCVELRNQGAQTELLVVDPLAEKKDEGCTVREFVVAQLGKADAASFVARLVRPAPESTTHGRRVLHKVFGEGRAVSERGQGPKRQVKVDFPGVGLKTLHARFLEFLD